MHERFRPQFYVPSAIFEVLTTDLCTVIQVSNYILPTENMQSDRSLHLKVQSQSTVSSCNNMEQVKIIIIAATIHESNNRSNSVYKAKIVVVK